MFKTLDTIHEKGSPGTKIKLLNWIGSHANTSEPRNLVSRALGAPIIVTLYMPASSKFGYM